MNRFAGLLAAQPWIAAAHAEPPPAIGAQQLLARAAARDPALVVLDVPTPAEHAAGLRDRDVVHRQSGRRAALAPGVLARHGDPRLAHRDGDLQGWEAAGWPVGTGAAATASAPGP